VRAIVLGELLFVVESTHEGTDVCVRRATAEEVAEEQAQGEGWAMSYASAVALARESARRDKCRWFDFSSDPASEEGKAESEAGRDPAVAFTERGSEL
jgi:hypothetical protein